jgi:hypothetical protein
METRPWKVSEERRVLMKANRMRPLGFTAITVLMVMGWNGKGLAQEYQVTDMTDGGTIKGVAIWEGELPTIPPLPVKADLDTCGETAPSPVLKVDPKSKGLQHVLVYLEQVEKGKAP